MKQYDAIIIGGGHNGLVAAAYLGKAGKKVLVMEKRKALGGVATTEEIFPGFKINTGAHDAGLFSTEVVGDFDLSKHGLEFITSPAAAFAPGLNSEPLCLWRDVEKSQKEIAKLSTSDAEKYPEFVAFIHRCAEVFRSVLIQPPPDVKNLTSADLFSLLKSGLQLKKLGKQDMMEFLRILPMSVREFLDDRFENEALKGLLGCSGVTGSKQGPMAAGTALMFFYQLIGNENGGFRSSAFVKGGIAKISEALANVNKSFGAEIRLDSAVRQIKISDYSAQTVVLESGEEISAQMILSNADPETTFFKLVGAPNLEPVFNRKVQNIRFRGTTAKLNLALTGLPEFPNLESRECLSGHIIICPNLEYLERAYDDAKYGKWSENPYLDIVIPTLLDPALAPENHHIMSVTMQYAPFDLRQGNWGQNRQALENTILKTMKKFGLDVTKFIKHKRLLTPLDLQEEYGLPEGSIFHGQMALDQLLFMRPVPGFRQYRTPIKNLFLCGAGTHPGGGVTGLPGKNCASVVLKRVFNL